MFNNLSTPDQWLHFPEEVRQVVLDCRFDLAHPDAGLKAYEAGHLPAAQYAHLEKDLSGTVTEGAGRHPLPDPRILANTLGASGIGADTQVLCYDDQGGTMAARMWWLLRWLGHSLVAVLDGGWKRWIEEGHPVTTEVIQAQPTLFEPRPHPYWNITTEQVRQKLDNEGFMLVDARAENRFLGEVEPIDSIAGHIPGAINFPFEKNLDEYGNFLAPETLRCRYQQALNGITPDKVVVMCGSGVTACHTLLAMEVAGLPGAKLYGGSWSEWIRDPSRPIVTGRAD